MRFPFGSGRAGDEHDEDFDDDVYAAGDDLDVYGGDDALPAEVGVPAPTRAAPPPAHRVAPTNGGGEVGYDDDYGHYDNGDDASAPGPRSQGLLARLRGAGGRSGAAGPVGDDGHDERSRVTAREFSERMEELRTEAGAEQRTAWTYLGVLGMLSLLIVGFGYGCSDLRTTDVATADPAQMAAGGEPSRLVFRVDGDVIALSGSVPDDAARRQVVAAAASSYGQENVVDELVVDDGTTLDDGTIRVVGSALFDDERPKAVQDAISEELGLTNRGFEVGFVDTVLDAVDAVVALGNGPVVLSGVLPDDQSVADFAALVGEVWGQGNVDASALSVGATTWTDGRIRLTGTAVEGDQRIGEFSGLASERLATLVTVDTSALTLSDGSVARARIQESIDELLLASPIVFAPDSANIDPASDELLTELAALLQEVPDTPFEIVGHTDNVGDENDNLVLSQDRAAAVVARLTQLGVSPDRMSSRGEGESSPIADNATDEGKAANRRIEFILVGLADLTGDGTDGDGTDTTAAGG